MFKHILIPTDGSELSEKAVKAGIDFAKSIGAKVTGFRAVDLYPWMYGDYVPFDVFSPEQRAEQEIAFSTRILKVVTDYAKTAGVTCKVYHAESIVPYEGIIKAAEDEGCDLIFMASHGRRGLAGLLLGSETVKVLTHCKIPVLVYR
jgi:nucleotide-binding universal stress UspA family protein